MTLLPRSLYGRLVLLLVVVLVTAQLLGLALHLHDRSELLREASGMQAARRIGDSSDAGRPRTGRVGALRWVASPRRVAAPPSC